MYFVPCLPAITKSPYNAASNVFAGLASPIHSIIFEHQPTIDQCFS